MLFIGPAGYPPGSADMVDAVRRVHGLGLNALEVQFVRNVQMAEGKAHEARLLAERLGVRLSAHAPYYISLSSPSMETVAKSREWILRAARAAHALGAWIVVVHAASYTGAPSAAVTDNVVMELTKCREVLDMERNPVVMGLETMGKKGQWGTIDEIHEVMGRVKGVQPVVDFAHIHARGGGSLRGEEGFQVVFDRYDARPTARIHCHFSGIEFTGAGERNHLPLSSNSPDYAPLRNILKKRNEDITLICETPNPSEDAGIMRDRLV
jgi:deoxyribonuclease-4